MNRILGAVLALVCLLTATPSGAALQFHADKVASASLTAASTGCTNAVDTGVSGLVTKGLSTAALNISGTWTGTVTFKGSIDGSNYVAIKGYPQSGAAAALTTTANGNWFFRVAGYAHVCAYFSTASSGTVVAAWSGSVHEAATPPVIGTPINCYLAATTATTSTQITGCELVTGSSIYVTSVTLSGDIASTTNAPATLQSGTSTGCTGPVVLFSCHHAATDSCTANFNPPIKATVSHGLCLLDAVTGTKTATVVGYVAAP